MNYSIDNGYNNFKNEFWIRFEEYSSTNNLTVLRYATDLLLTYQDFKKKISRVTNDPADEEYVKFIIANTKTTYTIEGDKIVFDELAYSNFVVAKFLTELELDKIIEFLDGIIHNEKINVYRNAGGGSKSKHIEDDVENDFSDTLPLERLILAEKYGVINLIKSLQTDPHNTNHTAEILSSITGIKSSTIAKNLGVMLGKAKNDFDKNSPYKNPKNLQAANNKLNRLKIDVTKLL